MKHRKLRIAWSVGCGIVCLLLIVLWMRSYWRVEILFHLDKYNHVVGIGSEKGVVYLWPGHTVPLIPATGSNLYGWQLSSTNMVNRLGVFQWGNFQWSDAGGITTIQVPYWFVTPLVAAAACLPWIKRFSLRTLLISTTLLAVLLGTMVWASK